MGELAHVVEIDGRTIGDGEKGPVTDRLQKLHQKLTRESGEELPF